MRRKRDSLVPIAAAPLRSTPVCISPLAYLCILLHEILSHFSWYKFSRSGQLAF